MVDNFKEIFFSPIPPSKNNFRAMVPRENPMPSRSVVGGFMSPNMGKANDDIEMGRKGVWAMAEHGDGKDGNNNERFHVNDNELNELSPDMGNIVNGDEQINRPNNHPRNANWEMSPEVMALSARRA